MKKKDQINQTPDETDQVDKEKNTESVEDTDKHKEKVNSADNEPVASSTEGKKAVTKKTKKVISKPAEEKEVIDNKKSEKREGKSETTGLTVIVKEYEKSQEEEKDDKKDTSEGEGTKEPEINYYDYSREELVEKLTECVLEKDISVIKSIITLIKVAFLKHNKEEKTRLFNKYLEEGGNRDDYQPVDDPIEIRFKAAFEVYKTNKAAFLEEQERIKQENLKRKKEILVKLKELINSEETLKKTYDNFKELQVQWKEFGMVPANEVSNLWQSYHFLVEKFFDKVKINKELKDLDLKKNLEAKIRLCEKTEELLLETSIITSFKQLQKYHEEWKEIGPIPVDKREEVWERFKTATDKINERRREYYEKQYEEQEKNLIAKTALCEKVEEIVAIEPQDLKEWQYHTNQMNELFNIWRTIGRAPKKQNKEIWKRFKTCLNTFFNNKKEYLYKIKQEQLNNYNLKLDICIQAENLKDSTDWVKITRELINLQNDWKKTGPVPRKHSDKIWKRFRAACDEFFNKKADYFANIHKHENENLKKKKEIIEKIKNFEFGSDKNENLKYIKDFQRQWMDIGFVPIKEKESIQKEFRNVVSQHLEKLKISVAEMDKINYKTRFESMKNIPGADKMIRKERSFLINRINRLRDDLKLWENNIGFFADTGKASLLKEEFENKINKAKQDLILLEAKLKYLNDVTG
jgi:hypothetical protein